jgi:hypothetical protein
LSKQPDQAVYRAGAIFCLLLTVALTWFWPIGAGASTPFQSSPLIPPSPTPRRPTATVTATAGTAVTPGAQQSPTASPSPTIAAPVAATPTPAPIATATRPSSYLPPPTLTSPGQVGPSIAGGQPAGPLSAAPATPSLLATVAPEVDDLPSDAILLARLIDRAVIAVGYVWLVCGAVTLVLVLVGFYWAAQHGSGKWPGWARRRHERRDGWRR